MASRLLLLILLQICVVSGLELIQIHKRDFEANFTLHNVFPNLGPGETLSADHATKLKTKRGEILERMTLRYNRHRIWGGDSIVVKETRNKKVKVIKDKLVGSLRRRAPKHFNEKADPMESIKVCLSKFAYPMSSATTGFYEIVWYNADGSEDTELILAHEVTVEGQDAEVGLPYSVSCLVDMKKGNVLISWKNFNTLHKGGNYATTMYLYGENKPPLEAKNVNATTCQLSTNDDVINIFANGGSTSLSYSSKGPAQFQCEDGLNDPANGGYGPSNDCFYNANILKKMMMDDNWGGCEDVAQITGNGKINIVTQYGSNYENAFWSSTRNAFYAGNGGSYFYPLCTCSDVVAHELGHALTASRSKLVYSGESGCINEAFSDVVAESAERFATGSNDWEIAKDCVKTGSGIRNMKNPGHYSNYFEGQCTVYLFFQIHEILIFQVIFFQLFISAAVFSVTVLIFWLKNGTTIFPKFSDFSLPSTISAGSR